MSCGRMNWVLCLTYRNSGGIGCAVKMQEYDVFKQPIHQHFIYCAWRLVIENVNGGEKTKLHNMPLPGFKSLFQPDRQLHSASLVQLVLGIVPE